VGVGLGKSGDVASAMEKATRAAKKALITVPLTSKGSLPYEVGAKFGASRIRLWPAPGRGLSAGSAARSVLTLAGVRDAGAKFLSKSKNQLNNARVTIKALSLY
jgi:small subunit ribosomal protein S5